MDWLYLAADKIIPPAQNKPLRRQIRPVCWRIKPVHLVLITSLKLHLIFLIQPFLLVFSCFKRDITPLGC